MRITKRWNYAFEGKEYTIEQAVTYALSSDYDDQISELRERCDNQDKYLAELTKELFELGVLPVKSLQRLIGYQFLVEES
jgi:hypothetical protein